MGHFFLFRIERQTGSNQNGEHSEVPPDVLPGPEVQQSQEVPRDAIQEVPGVEIRSGQEALRQEAAGIRRTVQTHPEKEGKDDEEDRAAHGVHGVQAAHPGAAEAGEALRAGRRQEEEGADDPVLSHTSHPVMLTRSDTSGKYTDKIAMFAVT